MIDLQHMMNPLGPSPKAVEAIKNNLSDIHKYTGPLKDLLKKIAKLNNVNEDQIMLSDGADGALTLIAQSIFKGKQIVIPQPCFHRYKDYPYFLMKIEFYKAEETFCCWHRQIILLDLKFQKSFS